MHLWQTMTKMCSFLNKKEKRQRDCTVAYNDNVFIRQGIGTQWLYAAFCICTPHIAKQLYSEVMLNINNECNGKINQVIVSFQRA